MQIKAAFFIGFMVALSIGAANAQPTTSPASPPDDPGTPVRSPVLGDPAPAPDVVRQPDTPARAAADAQSDKQPAGTTNGNQPDRAAAGAGGGGR